MAKISMIITPKNGEKYSIFLSHIENNGLQRTTILGEDLIDIKTFVGNDEVAHVEEVHAFILTLGYPSDSKIIEADQATRNFFSFIRGH